MTNDFDNDLSFDQWETLKALRPSGVPAPKVSGWILDQLVAQDLVAMVQGGPVITAKGRSVVLRGSPRLWDLAA
ncbi:hypothetical protein BH11PSE4_BH11PSE4_42900 [soil metagenome]